jgi:hypothetical protein
VGADVTDHRTPRPSPLVLAVLGFWLVAPFLLVNRFAQDAVPFVAAGEVARTDPGQVYSSSGDLYVIPADLARASCDATPSRADCAENVAFVSPPTALPVALLASVLGPTPGVLAMRLAASVCLVAGVLALRRRLTARHPDVDPVLAIVLLLLTPMFMVPAVLGQSSPLLFLSAAIGLAVAGRSRTASVGVGILWAAAVAFKLTPVVLIVVLVVRRRWLVLGAGLTTMVVLALAALPLGGGDMWRAFVDSSVELQPNWPSNPYNGSLEAAVHAVVPDTGGTIQDVAVWGTRVGLAAAMAWVALRIDDEDSQWAFAWLGSFLLVPIVWWHYLWVALAAVIVAMAATTLRNRLASPTLLVAMAAATVPVSLVNGTGSSVPLAQFLFLVVAVAWSGRLAMATQPATDAAGATPTARAHAAGALDSEDRR